MKINISKNHEKIFIATVLAIIVAGIIIATIMNSLYTAPTAVSTTTSTPAPQASTISYKGIKGQTALAQLEKTSKSVITKSSSYGEYVDSIGSLKGGQNGKYWTFYVNNKMSEVGASTYTSKGGEAITWKYEK